MSTPAGYPTGLALLRAPFPPNQISQKPQPYSKDSPKQNCGVCGGYHGMPALHLDYVGHAALTDRFLDADPQWTWAPLAYTAEGMPAFDKTGGMWIKLTICGVTRLGYGDAAGKTGGNAVKEIIGDALRNAGMRFGAALGLWHKGDLHDAGDLHDSTPNTPASPVGMVGTELAELNDLKREVAAAGRAVGLTVADLMDRFARDNGGLTLSDATADELLAFRWSLPAPAASPDGMAA